MPVTLILNEALSNALQHGFPGGASGEVLVRLERAEDGRVLLEEADDGVGFDSKSPGGGDGGEGPASGGMGLQVLELFARQMQGDLVIESAPGKGAQMKMQFFMAFTTS
jgi:two-component sensor histidine kinase